MAGLSIWFTVGLFLDAWAHNNVPGLETFFTPWHGVFYSGGLATSAWVAWTVRGAMREREHYLRAVPVGYGAAVVAIVVFALSGVGDLIWHTVFGIEQSINILFSPTHLGLGASMFVIVTTPLRSAWANPDLPLRPGLRRLLPAVLSVAFATTIVALFLQYANVTVFGSGDVITGLSDLDEGYTANLVKSMVVTNLVLLLPLLALARRWVLPFGTATAIYTAAAALAGAVTDFDNPSMIVGLVAAGVLVDLLALWLRPTADRPGRLRAFAGLAPLITWTTFIAAAFLDAPHWPGVAGTPAPVVELYTGAPMVQALLGLLVSLVLLPPKPAVVPAT